MTRHLIKINKNKRFKPSRHETYRDMLFNAEIRAEESEDVTPTTTTETAPTYCNDETEEKD